MPNPDDSPPVSGLVCPVDLDVPQPPAGFGVIRSKVDNAEKMRLLLLRQFVLFGNVLTVRDQYWYGPDHCALQMHFHWIHIIG